MTKDTKPPGESPPAPDNRSLIARWKHEEPFDRGFVPVPVRFLELYAHLKPHPLTLGEAMFVLELMSFKWTVHAPFPSYKRIAERMNVSDKMARRYAQGLETKGYLVRKVRKNSTNMFDLTGLFDALMAATKRERHAWENLTASMDFKAFEAAGRRTSEESATK